MGALLQTCLSMGNIDFLGSPLMDRNTALLEMSRLPRISPYASLLLADDLEQAPSFLTCLSII